MRSVFIHVFLLLITIVGGCYTTANCQYYYYNNKYYDTDLIWEFGAGIGAMNCITDIGGSKTKNSFYANEINYKATKPSFNFYAGVMYQQTAGALQIS